MFFYTKKAESGGHGEPTEQKPIGKYGMMHLGYLKKHRRGKYTALLGKGRLGAFLSGIDERILA